MAKKQDVKNRVDQLNREAYKKDLERDPKKPVEDSKPEKAPKTPNVAAPEAPKPEAPCRQPDNRTAAQLQADADELERRMRANEEEFLRIKREGMLEVQRLRAAAEAKANAEMAEICKLKDLAAGNKKAFKLLEAGEEPEPGVAYAYWVAETDDWEFTRNLFVADALTDDPKRVKKTPVWFIGEEIVPMSKEDIRKYFT